MTTSKQAREKIYNFIHDELKVLMTNEQRKELKRKLKEIGKIQSKENRGMLGKTPKKDKKKIIKNTRTDGIRVVRYY